jgi:hypothetical protein
VRSRRKEPRGARLLIESILFAIPAIALFWFYPYGLRWEFAVPIFLAGAGAAVRIVERMMDAAEEHPRFAKYFDEPS